MNILETIERKHYIATDSDVEQLAATHLTSDALTKRSDGQYLRILVAAMRAKFGSGKGSGRRRKLTEADVAEQSEALAAIHTRFYASVLKGVTTDEVADHDNLSADERRARAAARNGRAGFARSAASTLQAYIRAGGDIRGLDVATVTKTELRAFARVAQAPDDSPEAHAAHVTIKRLARDMDALADVDPDAARLAIDEAMAALQAIGARLASAAHAAQAPPSETQVFRQKTRARFAAQRAA
jgi:hypothetical protein